jgi:hypothetical protein
MTGQGAMSAPSLANQESLNCNREDSVSPHCPCVCERRSPGRRRQTYHHDSSTIPMHLADRPSPGLRLQGRCESRGCETRVPCSPVLLAPLFRLLSPAVVAGHVMYLAIAAACGTESPPCGLVSRWSLHRTGLCFLSLSAIAQSWSPQTITVAFDPLRLHSPVSPGP